MKIKIAFLSLFISLATWSQVNLTSVSATYNENFNTLANSGTPSWTDNSPPLIGWYSTKNGLTYTFNNGSNNANNVYSFGATSATERALGAISTATTHRFAVKIKNNDASQSITSLNVNFIGEHWRVNTTTQSLTFDYQKGATSLTAGTWTAFSTLDFSNITTGTAAALDGNLSANQTAKSGTITITLAPGEEVWLRWTKAGTTSHGLAIDDLSITATFGAAGCSTPTTQSSLLTKSNVSTTGTDLSWTNGATASGSLVTLRTTATTEVAPATGTSYTANTIYTSAPQTATSSANFVVFRGAGTSVAGITGLTAGTQYTATAYAYNDPGACYNTASPTSITFYTLATEPTAHSASFNCTTASASQINLSFAAANTLGGNGYLILYKVGSAITGVPTDATLYTAGNTVGDAIVAGYTSSGADTTYNVTGLNSGTTYYFSIIPFNSVTGITETYNYRVLATVPSTSCITTSAPEINIKGVVGSNPSIANGDTTPQGTDNTLFATTVVGSSQSKTFRIENLGTTALNITSISFVGGNLGDFSLSGISLPATVGIGLSLDFTITFSPTAAGVRNTTVTIVNDDNDENPYTYLIQGTGVVVAAIDMNVTGNGQSILDNSIYPTGTNHTAFGVATVGVSTVVRTFTIENLGSTDLSLTGTPYVTISGANASDFSVTSQPSTNTISGSSSITFMVTFNPASPGSKFATITIANNDPDENPYNFNISGTAKGANNIYVYGGGFDIIKGSTTTSLTNLTNFGSVAVSTGVKQNTFVITNLSGASRFISSVTISGADASMFTVVSQPTINSVGNGNSTSFTINFTPTSVGIKNATVTFNVTDTTPNPDPIDPTFSFAILGNGIVYTPCNNNSVQTIVIQDFEDVPATPTWTYSTALTSDSANNGTLSIAGGTYDNGSGPKNAFIDAKSLQFNGYADAGETSSNTFYQTATITFDPVDVSIFNNINMSLKVGAFRSSSSQGLDINDIVQVESSIDGGVNWSIESVLRGYNNSRWDFNATGVFNAYYTGTNNGVSVDTRNGNAELANGYATYYVKNLPSVSNLLIRIIIKVERADEIWALDNIKIEGQIPVSTTWQPSLTWSNGAPTSNTKAFIDAGYDTNTYGNIHACECQVNASKTLSVTNSGYIEIQSNITNNGTINVENNSSIVQVNDAAINTGTINYERIATLRNQDYVYWSSPVEGKIVNTISPLTPTSKIYKWNPTILNPNNGYGNWVAATGETMEKGKGYILRGPSTYSTTVAAPLTATFSGKMNNGIIDVPIARENYTGTGYNGTNGTPITKWDDNWNLVGNPYPSAIKVLDFLNANTNIEGAVRVWTHGNLPSTSYSDPFYNSFVYNYTPADYIVHNGTGTITGPSGFNGYIAGGQGFFVLMQDGSADSSQHITFNNALRNKTYSNSQFYKTASTQTNSLENIEKHRIWLDLVNTNGSSVRTLVGYVEGATLEKDRLFDAYGKPGTSQNIFTVINEEETACIQARPLPFNEYDQVPVGITIAQAGNYNIAIAAVDGLFEDVNQAVFLEDKQLNLIHDLRTAPYSFIATTGINKDRFVLRYTNTSLNNNAFNGNAIDVIVYSQNNTLNIKSMGEELKNVVVYDILGRELAVKNNINSFDSYINGLTKSQSLIVKITLKNGSVISKKIIL